MHMCGHVPKNTMPVFPPCSQEVEEFDIQYVTRKEVLCPFVASDTKFLLYLWLLNLF